MLREWKPWCSSVWNWSEKRFLCAGVFLFLSVLPLLQSVPQARTGSLCVVSMITEVLRLKVHFFNIKFIWNCLSGFNSFRDTCLCFYLDQLFLFVNIQQSTGFSKTGGFLAHAKQWYQSNRNCSNCCPSLLACVLALTVSRST